jgi:hypothetical protein
MDLVPSDKAQHLTVPIWSTYQSILDISEGKTVSVERVTTFFAFLPPEV